MNELSSSQVPHISQCKCQGAAPGTIADEETQVHLWLVSSTEASFSEDYLVCPFSGVVWHRSYREERVTVSQTVRTNYQQPKYDRRTVAVAQMTLYKEPQPVIQAQGGYCGFPNLPLYSLVWATVQAHQLVGWHCGNLQQSGKLFLSLWIDVPAPLDVGETQSVRVASPLECITQQVLQKGNSFAVIFGILGCRIGNLIISEAVEIPSYEFVQQFDYSASQRNLQKEWWATALQQKP